MTHHSALRHHADIAKVGKSGCMINRQAVQAILTSCLDVMLVAYNTRHLSNPSIGSYRYEEDVACCSTWCVSCDIVEHKRVCRWVNKTGLDSPSSSRAI